MNFQKYLDGKAWAVAELLEEIFFSGYFCTFFVFLIPHALRMIQFHLIQVSYNIMYIKYSTGSPRFTRILLMRIHFTFTQGLKLNLDCFFYYQFILRKSSFFANCSGHKILVRRGLPKFHSIFHPLTQILTYGYVFKKSSFAFGSLDPYNEPFTILCTHSWYVRCIMYY